MDQLKLFIILVVVLTPIYLIRKRAALRRMGLMSYRNIKFVGRFKPEVVREKARQLSDEALLGAYHLPDTQDSAKAVIGEELVKRGYDDKRIADWRRPVSELTAPPAAKKPIEPARYLRMVRTRRRLFGAYRFLAITFCILSPTIIIPILGLLLLMPFAALAGFLGRDRVVRILLLRPFGAKDMTRPLKRVVLHDLGAVGVVFTLADRNYKPNFLLTSWSYVSALPRFLIAPVLRQTHGFATVRNEVGFTNVAFGLCSRWRLSFVSFLNGGQALTIHSSDSWWQNVIDLLMHSSDIIVMDVSRVSQGSSWEIHRLEGDVLVRKCIFIVQEHYQQDGAQSIAHLFPADAQPELHVYDEHGHFKNPEKFRAVLETAVGRAVQAWRERQPSDIPVNAVSAS
jgi:hypothetical protein